MARQRLRTAHSEEQLAQIYAQPHDHLKWVDHHLRVEATVRVGRWMLETMDADNPNGADLSCGNGHILNSLPLRVRHFGDFAPGYAIHGPIEKTLTSIPFVDMFVCSETLEHLDDPDLVLRGIRTRTNRLLLSTPVECWNDSNLEHYWAWSREDVEAMLSEAGFRSYVYSSVDFRPMGLPYCFGIWGAL